MIAIRVRSVCTVCIQVAVVLMFPLGGYAEDQTVYVKSTVTGSNVQPTVSYIIPWQSAAKTEAFHIRLGPSFLEGTFDHLDEASFRHEVALREQLAKSTTVTRDAMGGGAP